MRKFRFRLEKLLQVRRHKEREWELKLAEATGECVLTQSEITERQGNSVKVIEGYGKSKGKIDLNDLYARDMYWMRLTTEIQVLEQLLAEKEAERVKVQSKYIVVSRDRKVLDKLKERRESDYYKQSRQEEFKDLNDVNTSSRIRKTFSESNIKGDMS